MHLSSRLSVWRREVMYNCMQPLCTKNNVHVPCDDTKLFWCWKVAGGGYIQRKQKTKTNRSLCQHEQVTQRNSKAVKLHSHNIWKYTLGVCLMASLWKLGGFRNNSLYKLLDDL